MPAVANVFRVIKDLRDLYPDAAVRYVPPRGVRISKGVMVLSWECPEELLRDDHYYENHRASILAQIDLNMDYHVSPTADIPEKDVGSTHA